MKDFLQEKKEQLFDGELTITKTDFWLVTILVFVLGVLYGLVKAPLTHGLTITCGNNNGNTTCAAEDECECIGCCEMDDNDDEENDEE